MISITSMSPGSRQITLEEAVVLADSDFKILTWSESAEKLYGWTGLEVIGKDAGEILPTATKGGMSLWELPPAEFATWKGEVTQKDRSGRELRIQVQMAPVQGASGGIFGYLLIAKPIILQRHDAEFRLAAIIESSDDAIISKNLDGYITSWNSAAERLFKYTAEEAIGRHITMLIPQHLQYEETQIIESLKRGERVDHFETRRMTKDGELRDLSLTISPVRNEEGKIIGASKIARDITEHKKVENAMRESEKKLRAMFVQAGVGVCLLGSDYRMQEVNPRFTEIMGYTTDELTGSSWLDRTEAADLERTISTLEELARSEREVATFENRYIKKSGIPVWVRVTMSKLRDNSGKIEGFIGVVEDISEQKQAEIAVKESETRFRILADNIQNLAWMANPDGYIFWFNQRWFEFLGARIEDLKGWRWENYISDDQREMVRNFLQDAWKENEPWELTFSLTGAGDQNRWFLARAFPVRDRNDTILRWIGTFTDIDEQKSMSERLEQMIRERTRALQSSNEDLQRFAHVASHDLKEPVRKIKTFINLLRDDFADELPAKAGMYISKAMYAAERVNSMIEGVLKYSSLNASEKAVSTVDLNEIVKQVENDLELLVREKNAVIRTENLPEIEGAAILLHQLFYNLVNNSLKFSRQDESPVITITDVTAEGDNFATIEVSDNGIGFGQEFADKIFETFVRLHPKDRFEGTGLGLSLCKKIAERHNGSISAISLPRGACFRLKLPFTQSKSNI